LTKRKEKTRTVFRKWKDNGDVIALFPDDREPNGMIGSYEHVGQHGGADYHGVLRQTKPAMPKEYAELKHELQSHPYRYNIDPRKRFIRRRR
jgi:hypothetical protein